jgi:hypothetical protein
MTTKSLHNYMENMTKVSYVPRNIKNYSQWKNMTMIRDIWNMAQYEIYLH